VAPGGGLRGQLIPQEMKKRKSSDHKVHLIACILQWAFGCSEFIAMENQSFAELTPL